MMNEQWITLLHKLVLSSAMQQQETIRTYFIQTEELEALKAIYEDDMKIDEENGSHCVTIKTGNGGLFAQFEVHKINSKNYIFVVYVSR